MGTTTEGKAHLLSHPGIPTCPLTPTTEEVSVSVVEKMEGWNEECYVAVIIRKRLHTLLPMASRLRENMLSGVGFHESVLR